MLRMDAAVAIKTLEAVKTQGACTQITAVEDIRRLADIMAIHAVIAVLNGEDQVAIAVRDGLIAVFAVFILQIIQCKARHDICQRLKLREKRLRKIDLPTEHLSVPLIPVPASGAIDWERAGFGINRDDRPAAHAAG